MKNMYKKICLLALGMLSGIITQAQSMTDGIFMSKNNICGGVFYTNDSWKNYWEGTLYRENKNIGTLTTQSVMAMANYGITDRLNVLAALPYVWTKPSAGVRRGYAGFQDVSLALKYNLIQTKHLSVIGSVGGSLPTNNYVFEDMPLSIGFGSKTAFARGILYYTLPKDLAITANASYTRRSNVSGDVYMYYTDRAYFSNEMTVPDVVNLGLKFGHYSFRWQLEATVDQQITNSSLDIRRNDMPMVCDKFDFTKVGFIAAYRVPALKDLQIMLTGSQVVAGRNVGESTTLTLALTKYLDFRKNRASGVPTGPICRPGDKNHAGSMDTESTEEKH